MPHVGADSEPAARNLDLRRTIPVLGAFVVGAIAYAPLYCFPLLAPQFEADFHTSRELGQMPWTMFLLVSAACSPLLGRAYDKFADRNLLLIGTLLLAAGWLMAAVAGSVLLLILAYGALLAVGLQLVFVGTSTATARRYAGVAGLALGIAYAGPGIGVALALPIAAGVLPELGWRATLAVFGVLSLLALPFVVLMTSGSAVMVPVGRKARSEAAATTDRPAAGPAPAASGRTAETGKGLHETSAPGALGAAQEPHPIGIHSRPLTLRRTVRTRRFLILLAGAVAIGCIDEGVFQTSARHAVTRGISEDFAATMLAFQCYAYVVGQVVGGGLSDRFGRRFVGLFCAFLIGIGATSIFSATGSTLGLAVAGNAIYGFGIGATIAIRSATFSDVFGGASFGAVFGIVAVAYPAGGIIAMNAGGILYDRVGSYWPVYFIAMVSAAAWAAALLVAGPRRHGLGKRLRKARARMPV
jgi:MFS transporter, OFA family, oxalate/formate antiporter